MSREKQLVKNTAIITIGKVCTQLISFVLLPLYTSLLSTEEYGIVDLLNSYVFLLIPIVTFQLEQAVFRHLIDARNNEEEKKILISTTIFTVIIQIIVFSLIFIVGGAFFKNEYKYFLLVNVIATVLSSLMLQISRGLGDNKTYAIGSFITATLTVILNVILVAFFKLGAYGMLISVGVANFVTAIYVFIKKAKKYTDIRKTRKSTVKMLLKYSMPLIPNAISWWILNVSDRTIITTVLGIGMNGIYSAASKFSTLYTHLYNIFNTAWTESASLHIKDIDRDEFFSKIMTIAIKVFFTIQIGIITCMPFIFNILINEKFGEAYYQIPILILGSFFNIMIGLISVIYIAKKKTKEIAKTSTISAVINIIVHLVLIKFIGIYAASISTVIAYLIMTIARMIDIKKYVKIKIDSKLILSMIIMIIYVFISYYINEIHINVLTLMIASIYSIIINRQIIRKIFERISMRIKGDNLIKK